ncbi:MAG: hypothetical protein ACPLW7_05125 [Minisyncoccia bacterium]
MKGNKNQQKIKLYKKDTYLKMIINSCGAKIWRNNYGMINNKKIDLVENGALSCAFFVTSILKIFDLISFLHLTVEGAEKDLIENNWKSIKISRNMPRGTVIIWEKQENDGKDKKQLGGHLHIGFYLGNGKAVSNSTKNGYPIIHHWTYQNSRKIIKAYYNKKLDS